MHDLANQFFSTALDERVASKYNNQLIPELGLELGSAIEYTSGIKWELEQEFDNICRGTLIEGAPEFWHKWDSKKLAQEISNLSSKLHIWEANDLQIELESFTWSRHLRHQLKQQSRTFVNLKQKLRTEVGEDLSDRLWQQFWEQLEQLLLPHDPLLEDFMFISPNEWIRDVAMWSDYLTSIQKCTYDRSKWQILQDLVTHCGCIFPFEKICIVCDRPTVLNHDDRWRLHGEGKPAIQFADGYSLYAYHGVMLPEAYQISPQHWRSEWLLREKNAELRRVLIQGIGYDRLCQELQAEVLDTWREYTLLNIEADIDTEPICLLKMTCPSTAHIHALRVPPYTTSARTAIRWVNWDTDPEEFVLQT